MELVVMRIHTRDRQLKTEGDELFKLAENEIASRHGRITAVAAH